MAAAAKRILSHLTKRSPSNVLPKEISGRLFPSHHVHKGSYFLQKGFATQAELTIISPEDTSSEDDNPRANISAMSNLKISPRHDLAMVFTCKVCETRSVKTTCKESYEKGVVVVRCGGCNNLHLIADRLGWFGEPSSVEEFLAAQGEEFKRGSADTLNLTLEDLAGSGTKP